MRIKHNYTCYNTEDLEELIAYTHRLCGPGGLRQRIYDQSDSSDKRYINLQPTTNEFLERKFVFADYYKSSEDIEHRVKLKPGDAPSVVRVVKPVDLFENLVESMAVMGAEEPEVPLPVVEEMVFRLSSMSQGYSGYYYYSRDMGLRKHPWSIGFLAQMEPPPRVRIMPSPQEKRPTIPGGMQRRQWVSGAADKAKKHLSYAVHSGHSGGKYSSDFHRAGMHIDKALNHAIKAKDNELIETLRSRKQDFLLIHNAIRVLYSELSEVEEG